MSPHQSPRILVIRRDNIGDLVLTTPLLAALRRRYPGGWLGVLANSYNAPVLAGNPDVDAVFAYTKAKHRAPGESLPGVFWRRWRMLRELRAMGIDEAILATPQPQPRALRLARWLRPRRIVGFGDLPGLDVTLPVAACAASEAEEVFRIAAVHGIDGAPPSCRVAPPPGVVREGNTIAVHISARKPSQRWPLEHFAATMRALASGQDVRFVLLWSPGASDNPLHPGDDAKADALLRLLGPEFPVEAVRTAALTEAIAALARCTALICADGGAMHLGAGLGLSIVCLFGDSDAVRWRPWGVPHVLLQKPSRQVADIAPDEVVAAFNALRGGIPAPSAATPS